MRLKDPEWVRSSEWERWDGMSGRCVLGQDDVMEEAGRLSGDGRLLEEKEGPGGEAAGTSVLQRAGGLWWVSHS